uniref:ATP synthase F0 subunit 8 n=1 Tax=Pselaphinae sp. 7 EF-2015 TaxID=1756861 RepID=A0A0S2M8S4_9COLE|nr:ATP synthase F0 subunit 8 [Pselaphinae sp. 7 EF-2015]
MPQMAPINWVFLYLMFILIFMMFNLMNFYYFFFLNNFKPVFFKKNIWKW